MRLPQYKHRHFESPRPWCADTGQGRWRYFFRIGPRHLSQQYANQTVNPKTIQPSVPQSNLHNVRKFVCVCVCACVSRKAFEWTTPCLQLQAISRLQMVESVESSRALSTFNVLCHEALSKLPSAAVLTNANGGLVADTVWTDLWLFKAKEHNPIRISLNFYTYIHRIWKNFVGFKHPSKKSSFHGTPLKTPARPRRYRDANNIIFIS